MSDQKVSALAQNTGLTLVGGGFSYGYIGSTPYKIAYGGAFGSACLDASGYLASSQFNPAFTSAYAPLAGAAFTGATSVGANFTVTVGTANFAAAAAATVPTVTLSDSSTNAASTAFVKGQNYVQNSILGIEYFGDGADGDVALNGSNTFSFMTKVGSIYALNRDVHIHNLVISGGAVLNMNACRLFIAGSLDLTNAAAYCIYQGQNTAVQTNCNGGNGQTGGLGGSAGVGLTGVTINTQFSNGQVGGSGGASAVGNPGINASLSGSVSTGGNSNGGGAGGAGVNTGGAAGAALSTVSARIPWRVPSPLMRGFVAGASLFSLIGGGAGGSGGGGGGGGSQGAGGGGGGGGGGVAYLGVRNIIKGSSISNAIFMGGGNGGNGGNAAGTNNGGGGGGAGGGGGYFVFIYGTVTGTGTITVNASGGSGGTGGAPIGTGINGSGGSGGDSGVFVAYCFGTGIVTSFVYVAGGAAGGVGVTTPGIGGAAVLTL